MCSPDVHMDLEHECTYACSICCWTRVGLGGDSSLEDILFLEHLYNEKSKTVLGMYMSEESRDCTEVELSDDSEHRAA